MDYAFYRQLFGNIRSDNKVDHQCWPSINQTNFNLIKNRKFQLNVPFNDEKRLACGQYGVLIVGQQPDDIAKELIQKKEIWKKKLAELGKFDKKNAAQSIRLLRKRSKAKISIDLRLYLNHFTLDPLPGFEANRNCLYTGGTITEMNTEDDRSLVYCSGPDLRDICCMPIGPSEGVMPTRLKIDQPILQISVDPVAKSTICTRQKNNITVLKRDGPCFKVAAKKKIRKSRYFTCCAIKNNLVALSKNVGKLALFDVNVNKLCQVQNIPQCSGSQAAQLHWRDNVLLFVRDKSLALVDPRGASVDWDFNKTLLPCEDICNYFESDSDESKGYIATTHNLFKLDLQHQKILHKWTHLMKNSPSFGQVITRDEEEVIVLQSSNATEGVLLRGGEGSMLPPTLMPGVTDALRDAQLHGFCLDPDVSNRARYTVTGTHLFQSGDKLKQATQNAGGDIFLRDIYFNDGPSQEEDQLRRESWNEFEETAVVEGGEASYSDIVSMTRALGALQLPPPQQPQQPPGPAPMYWPKAHSFQLHNLASYKDAMVQPILEIWDAPTECEEDAPMELDEIGSKQKVHEWLHQAHQLQ